MQILKNNSAVAALSCYCLSSIAMTVTNKMILSHYHFELNFLLLAIQSACCAGLLILFNSMKVLSFKPLKKSIVLEWFPVSLALVAMIYTGTKSLQYLSIPLVTIFKNLTIILTAYSERVFFNGAPVTFLTLCSFVLMVLSSLIASLSDIYEGRLLKSNAEQVMILVPYSWMMFNCLSTAFYVLMMKQKIKRVGFQDFDTVYYNK